jgi:hypothetical protein
VTAAALGAVIVVLIGIIAVQWSASILLRVRVLEAQVEALRAEREVSRRRLEAIQSAATELADRMSRSYAPTVHRYGLLEHDQHGDFAASPGLVGRISEEKYDGILNTELEGRR